MLADLLQAAGQSGPVAPVINGFMAGTIFHKASLRLVAVLNDARMCQSVMQKLAITVEQRPP